MDKGAAMGCVAKFLSSSKNEFQANAASSFHDKYDPNRKANAQGIMAIYNSDRIA